MHTPLLLTRRLPAGQGLAAAIKDRAPCLSLDWGTRQRSRFKAVDDRGAEVLVALPRGGVLRGGDMLVSDEGRLVAVRAADQPVIEASASDALTLMRAAYHLGNRHVALQIDLDRLVLEPDTVLAELLHRMGLQVRESSRPFEPEAGAYAQEPLHAHAAGAGRIEVDGQRASHSHFHPHPHGPARLQAHAHTHDHRRAVPVESAPPALAPPLDGAAP